MTRRAPVPAAVLAITLAVLCCGLAAPPARAQGPGSTERAPDGATILSQATGKMRRGLYEDAARLYEQARPEPGSAGAYNHALALLKTGRTDDGEQRLKDVVATARDTRVAADAAFNLGRSVHARAAGEQNAKEKLALLEQAAAAFRACVDAAPGDLDGARALEITRAQIKKTRDELEQREKDQQQADQQKQNQQGKNGQKSPNSPDQKDAEQQNQEQKNQDQQRQQKEAKQQLADQLSDLARQQDKAREETRQNQERAQQKRGDADAERQAARDSSERQEAVGRGTQSAAEKLDQQRKAEQTPSDAMDRAAKSLEQARDQQRRAQEALERNDLSAAQESQKQAADALRDAASAVESDTGKDEPHEKDAQSGARQDGQGNQPPQPQPQPRQKPKGDELANRLLEREDQARALRQRFLRSMPGRPTPVDKDW